MKANGLQEGDFIVIYSDVKCGKFVRAFSYNVFFYLIFMDLDFLVPGVIESRSNQSFKKPD